MPYTQKLRTQEQISQLKQSKTTYLTNKKPAYWRLLLFLGFLARERDTKKEKKALKTLFGLMSKDTIFSWNFQSRKNKTPARRCNAMPIAY